MKKTKIPTLSSLIAKHKFDWINSDITDTLFPQPTEISYDYTLFYFDKYISSKDAIKEMEKEGYRAANIYELLLWEDWNKKDWVIALGSVAEVRGFLGVPSLYVGGSGRSLGLRWFDGDWSSGCRFLAVRNSGLKFSESLKPELGSLDPWILGQLDVIEEIIKSIKNH